MKKSDIVERPAGGLRAVSRNLREDLWTGVADAAPRTVGPRWLRVAAVSGLVLLAAILFVFNALKYGAGDQIGAIGLLLTGIQTAALVSAPYRPVPAWWAATTAQTAVGIAMFEAHGLSGGRPLWNSSELALQAWVLFMLALRSRLRAAVEALVISLLTSLFLVVALDQIGYAPLTVVVLAIATLIGAALRGRNVARTQLVALEEQTAEERNRRALLEERNRIARELHDVVAHHMSVISIQAQAAPHLVENPSAELKENLASIRENAKEALTELRQVLGVLRSEHTVSESEWHAPQPTLDRLDELVANVRSAGLTVRTHTTGEPAHLAPGIELSAFRIIQEALSNAMRHAPGAEVRVEISHRPSDLTVRVANTAPTGPAQPSPSAGHGLLGMRERTAMLRGTLAFGATPDGGYEVFATLPTQLPAEPAELVEDNQ
ncbi:sensor histidine kinase [Streptomyces sp. NPDC087228]|uniref:sensor histidine kinase n=1 Tax=Streptomyces sp. NPDC087228 TaxID=3365772 RepID=UPI003808DDA7